MAAPTHIQFHPDTDSIWEPGKKCLMSDSMEGLIEPEDLFDKFFIGLRNPQTPVGPPVSFEIETDTEEEFLVHSTWDIGAAKAIGYVTPDNPGPIVSSEHRSINRSELEFVHTVIGYTGQTFGTQGVKIHKNPLRVEIWETDWKGTQVTLATDGRRANTLKLENELKVAAWLYVASFPVEEGKDSIWHPGQKCVLSGNLDKYTTPEELYNKMLEGSKKIEGAEEMQVEETDTEVKVTAIFDKQKAIEGQVWPPDSEAAPKSVDTFEIDKKELTMIKRSVDWYDIKQQEFHTKVHKDPCRVEMFVVNIHDDNKIVADMGLRIMLEAILASHLSKQEGAGASGYPEQ